MTGLRVSIPDYQVHWVQYILRCGWHHRASWSTSMYSPEPETFTTYLRLLVSASSLTIWETEENSWRVVATLMHV